MGGGTVPVSNGSSLPKLAQGPVGQMIEGIYRQRLDQFVGGGQYQSRNLSSKWYHALVEDEDHIKLSVYSPPDLSRPTFNEVKSHEFKSTKRGESFGPSWSTHWFRIQLTVPKSMKDAEHLEFEWDANNEGMVWTEDGNPLQGLTGGGERTEWIIPKSWRDGKEHTFYIEMACNKMFGNSPSGDSIQPPVPNTYYQLVTARLVDVNLAVRQLNTDFRVIGDAAREFPGNSWERHKALVVATEIMDAFERGNGSQDSILEARRIAEEYLGKNINSAKVYESGSDAIVTAIGHCHIDTCWLWPWAETKRKVARSWSNQCELMSRYPEHTFTASSAQQYKWLKQLYPYVWDRVKRKVKEGRFRPIGGSWVEHDTNMPSGESLVRQFLYGQRFFESNFGERCTTFWLPDTFGYSGQLPQICRLAGMSRFFTQKLSWNNINNFPLTTFKWVSLDGSQVMCHMPPSETYNASCDFGEVRRSISQHKSLDQDSTSLLVFGLGDGGGGPTREMIEKLRRCRGLSDTTSPSLPTVSIGNSVDDFFNKLEKKAESGTEFATWYGELYFEFHRGTYTSQANMKKNNRTQEFMMREIEYLATLATLKSKSYEYPKKGIDEIWENILLCQFHDCLPGSSIEMCYDDAAKLYAHNAKLAETMKKKALTALGYGDEKGASSKLAVLNTLPWARNELVKLPTEASLSEGNTYAFVSGGPGLALARHPSLLQSTASVEEIRTGVFILQNNHYKVEVESGVINSLLDLRVDREVIAKGGKANQFVIFDDKPLYWQAWDVEVYHLRSRKELASERSEILEKGPYRVSVVTKTQISEQSWIKTIVSLDASVDDTYPSYVSVEAEIEWRESMRVLKVEFPVDIVSTDASYEMQYGLVRRPTHYNTSWDMAKFEVCCHKFADLSEAGYGVSVLNDSKFGFATAGNVMRLSLLKAPKAPDGHADMGRHHVRWAIMPHSGPLSADTIRAGYNFNNPLEVVTMEPVQAEQDLFKSIILQGAQSLILDTIKRGEDDEDVSRGDFKIRKGKSIILRIYESLGGKSRGKILTTLAVKKVFKTNILEDDQEECEISGSGEINIELRAFEVATFRLQL